MNTIELLVHVRNQDKKIHVTKINVAVENLIIIQTDSAGNEFFDYREFLKNGIADCVKAKFPDYEDYDAFVSLLNPSDFYRTWYWGKVEKMIDSDFVDLLRWNNIYTLGNIQLSI